MGELGVYKIEERALRHYLDDREEVVKILTKLVGIESRCFVSAAAAGNGLKVTLLQQDGKWCSEPESTKVYDLGHLQNYNH